MRRIKNYMELTKQAFCKHEFEKPRVKVLHTSTKILYLPCPVLTCKKCNAKVTMTFKQYDTLAENLNKKIFNQYHPIKEP